jgi:expansin (peptidoglycan-binding protein)
LPSESIRKLVNTFSKQNNCASTPHLKPENNTDASCSNLAKKNASNFKSSTSVTIENVPSLIHLHRLKEAVSTFGKISNASMRAVPNGLDCCDIEFEVFNET